MDPDAVPPPRGPDDVSEAYRGWIKGPEQIVREFDASPINEDALRAALRCAGTPLEECTAADLAEVPVVSRLEYGQSSEGDQDHWGGAEATDALASLAGVDAGDDVLDVGCGLGGSVRYLAETRGCRATGLDMTPSRIESARRLTSALGMSDRVRFDVGNALDLPYADDSFTVVWGQSAWWLIPERRRFLEEARRVLRPGGRIAFEDRVVDASRRRVAEEAEIFRGAWSAEEYASALADAGFTVTVREDWTELMASASREAVEQWCDQVDGQVEEHGLQHAMYRAMREIQKLALAVAGVTRLVAVVAEERGG